MSKLRPLASVTLRHQSECGPRVFHFEVGGAWQLSAVGVSSIVIDSPHSGPYLRKIGSRAAADVILGVAQGVGATG